MDLHDFMKEQEKYQKKPRFWDEIKLSRKMVFLGGILIGVFLEAGFWYLLRGLQWLVATR